MGPELPPPRHPVSRRHPDSGSADPGGEIRERLLPRPCAELLAGGGVGARRGQLHQPGRSGPGGQRLERPQHPVPRRRPCGALCQRDRQRPLLLPGVSAHLHGLCRDPVDVLRQLAGRRRLAQTLRQELDGGGDPRWAHQGHDRGAPAVSRLQRAPDSAGGLLRAGSLCHGRRRAYPRGCAGIGPSLGAQNPGGGEPAPAAGHSAPAQSGVGLRLSRLPAGADGGGADPRLLPRARRLPHRQPAHRAGSGGSLLGAGQRHDP
ncbi:hypothetical protein D3C72_1357160 [compost metagenome]